jgi:hypothetical protein
LSWQFKAELPLNIRAKLRQNSFVLRVPRYDAVLVYRFSDTPQPLRAFTLLGVGRYF